MRSRGWIATTVGLVVLAAACTRDAATPRPEQEGPVAVGDAAPAFTLESASGGPVALSDYAGKSVLLYFSMGPG